MKRICFCLFLLLRNFEHFDPFMIRSQYSMAVVELLHFSLLRHRIDSSDLDAEVKK